MKPWMLAFAVSALTVLISGPGWAQDAGGPPPDGPPSGGHGGGLRQACAADIAKLCGDVDRSGIRQCMTDKFDQLSDGCKAAVAARRAHHHEQGGGGDAGAPPAN